MSDCARNRFNEKEDFQVVLGKGNPGESSCQQHTKWMAHWTRASSSAYGKSCSPLEDANDSTYCTEDSETSLFELKKSSVTERLRLGGNHEGIFMEKLNSNMWGVSHDARQEAEQKKNERRDESFQSSVMHMQKDFDDLFVPQQIPKLNVTPSNLMTCSHQECDPQFPRMTEMVMDHCKPAGGIMYLLEDPTCPNSDHAGKNLKVDNNSSSDCGMDEQVTGHHFANPNQEPLGGGGGKQFNLSENSDKGQTVGDASQNQKSRTPTGLHKKEVAAGVVLSLPVLGKEHKTLPSNYFMNSKQDDENFYVASHLVPDKHHDMNTHRMEYAANVTDSCMLPDPAANILIINSKGGAVTHERQPVDKFTDSVKQNGPCLFEKLTIPSKSQSIALSLMQKDNGCAERANEQLATLSIAGSPRYNKGNRFHNVNDNQHISSKGTTSSKQALSTPRTEIMDLDPPLFQCRMRNQVLNDTIRSSAGAEPSDKWLRRLLHDATDPHVYHRSKRPKTGDCGPVGVSDTDIVDHVEARCVRCWLGRLCRAGVAPVSHGEPAQGTGAAAEPDVAARELGGHFPSIKAMAMMGRVMSKVRP